MQSQPTPLRPEPRVDIGALASGFQLEAATRVAETIVHATTVLDHEDNPLGEKQQIALVESALRHFDGIELEIAATLKRELERDGVATWGLPAAVDKLLNREGQR